MAATSPRYPSFDDRYKTLANHSIQEAGSAINGLISQCSAVLALPIWDSYQRGALRVRSRGSSPLLRQRSRSGSRFVIISLKAAVLEAVLLPAEEVEVFVALPTAPEDEAAAVEDAVPVDDLAPAEEEVVPLPLPVAVILVWLSGMLRLGGR